MHWQNLRLLLLLACCPAPSMIMSRSDALISKSLLFFWVALTVLAGEPEAVACVDPFMVMSRSDRLMFNHLLLNHCW